MESFWLGVVGNMVAALIVAVIPILLVLARVSRRQRELATFFGLTPAVRAVRVVLSTYQPAVTEEHLASGATSTGWTGETVSADEFRGAQEIERLFTKSWTVPSVSSILDGLSGNGRGFGAVSAKIEPHSADLSFGNPYSFVVMGTGAKESNAMATRFLGANPDASYSVFRFAKDPDRGRAFERLPVKGYAGQSYFASEYESGPQKGELAVLQRITLESGKVVFLCAGKDSEATTIVARYLADNWHILLSRYKNQENGDFANLYLFSEESPTAPKLLTSVP
jgi:hypothetical protein